VPLQENIPSGRTSRQSTSTHENRQPKPQEEEGKHLFTVKPGGIADHLRKGVYEFLSDPLADP